MRVGGVLNTTSAEFLRKMIPTILHGMKSILSTSAIAHIMNAEITSAQEMLAQLEEDKVVLRKREHHVDGWTVPCETEPFPDTAGIEEWFGSLSEYVLFSPGATLPEIIAVIENGQLLPRDRSSLILRAMQLSRENGEFRLLAYFISEIMHPGGTGLSAQEAGEVLTIFEPRKLRNIDSNAAVDFIEQHFSLFKSPGGKAMALTRLGELELIENRLPQAEEHLRQALELSMETNTGDWIPSILSSMAEIPRDFEGMKEMAAEIDRVIDWLPLINDNEAMVRILATAATALAGLRMHTAADKAILSAMTLVPEVTLETQQVLEWCRAKVFIASGRRKAAMTMLQRALQLAESTNDQQAVMEILNAIVFEMKERPGYTVRSLISIMQSVSKRALISGNVSNRLYALDLMVDMYTRTLQIIKSGETAEKISEIVASSDILSKEPLTSWCEAYLGFLTGDSRTVSSGDSLLPGTDGFLKSLAKGSEPTSHARKISDHLVASQRSDVVLYALILAMEAYSRGFDRAPSIIAAALDSSFSSFHEDPFLSLKLCISGILASKDVDADDFFHSAQTLARQLDSLLLVWLLLRCRMKLNSERNFREDSALSLMLVELDEHIAIQLPADVRDKFMKRTGADRRINSLRASSGSPGGTLREIRDALAEKLEDDSIGIFEEISRISGRISSRSEISSSLEALGILASANRVLTLRVKGSTVAIIEGYGPGRWRLPSVEVEEMIKKFPPERISIDNFGENPFGSRRCIIVPTKKSVVPSLMERRLYSLNSQQGNYLLIEIDSPFDTIGRATKFFVECLCRQVGSALLLRDRESMAYIDSLTGSVVGYSWTKRLLELTDEITAATPLSVLIVDLDDLGEINSLFGYRAGDNALKTVVSTIKGVLRPNDMIGRLKEDKFGIFLPDTAGENAVIIAERICGVVAGTEIRTDRVPVTVCIGVAESSSSEDSPELIINRANAALNRGKSQGGNSAVLWSAEGDAWDFDSGMLTFFNTGDPGWDHSVGDAVLELLTAEEPALTLVAERLRDALRSEFIYLEDGNGNSSRIGSRILRKIPEEINEKSGDRISTHSGILGRYDALSIRLACGGRLISAWDNAGGISGSMKNIFRALAALSSLLIQNGSAIPAHPPEEQS